MAKSPDGIRSELMIKADSFPDMFQKYVDSPEVDIQYLVKRALIDSKIDISAQPGNAIWAGGKGFICKLPAGRKPWEVLTELAMSQSKEGKDFMNQLNTVVGK